MIPVLTTIHVINCLLLIVVVLLQSSKGGGLAGAFGGGGTSQAVFGGRGAGTFLSKATTVLAVLFMVTSLTLTLLSREGTDSDSAIRRAIESESRQGAPVQGFPTPVDPLPQGNDAAGTPPATAPDASGAPPVTGGEGAAPGGEEGSP